MDKVKSYIEKNKDRFLNELFELLRIPSISAQSDHKPDMTRCAEWLAASLMKAGADHADGFGCRTAGQSNYSGSSGRIGPPARDAGCADARAHRSYRNACFTGRSTTGRPDVHAQYDNGQHGNGCGAAAAIASRRGFYAGRSSGGRSTARPKN